MPGSRRIAIRLCGQARDWKTGRIPFGRKISCFWLRAVDIPPTAIGWKAIRRMWSGAESASPRTLRVCSVRRTAISVAAPRGAVFKVCVANFVFLDGAAGVRGGGTSSRIAAERVFQSATPNALAISSRLSRLQGRPSSTSPGDDSTWCPMLTTAIIWHRNGMVSGPRGILPEHRSDETRKRRRWRPHVPARALGAQAQRDSAS
jgi:hypothetical protein